MNDKKQIEELASLMADCSTTCDECFEKFERVMALLPIKKRQNYCQAYAYAQKAVEQGYRKIPKNSVVLSSEEHEILVKTAQCKIGNMKSTDFLKACISSGVMAEAVSTKEQVKQAVKEFAEQVKMAFYAKFDELIPSIMADKIDELLKEYEK